MAFYTVMSAGGAERLSVFGRGPALQENIVSAKKGSGHPVAEVRSHNGTPTVFVDGKPSSYYLAWMPTPDGGGSAEFKEVVRGIARLGIHLYTFENGTMQLNGPVPAWVPGPGDGREGDFDFSHVEEQMRAFTDADSEARLHIRLFLEMNTQWWSKAHPEECLVTSAGWQPEQSYASTVWRAEVNDFLRKFIAHVESIGMADRVLAYQVNTGTSCEWFKYALVFGDLCGDYSEPMKRYFRSWLRGRYNSDVKALRAAWRRDDVTFETAEVPSPEEQLQARYYPGAASKERDYLLHSAKPGKLAPMTFRDPAREENVADYLRATSDLSADLCIDFCRTVKEASGGRAMAGLFYGYWLGFGFTSDYFRDYPDSVGDNAKLQRSGHLGLQRVMESEYVDFFTSPMEYLFRGPGGASPPMIPIGALRLHGKAYIQENDDRSWHPAIRDYGACRNVNEFLAVYRRTLADAATSGQGTWSVSLPLHVQRARGIGGEPVGLFHAWHVRELPGPECARFLEEVGRSNRMLDLALETDRTPNAEIAVIIDDESFYYESYRKNLQFPILNLQRVQHLPRMGAPFEFHTLHDLVEGRLRPFKMYIFLNAVHLDDERRRKLKREIRRDGRVAVWMCGAGLMNRDASVENMKDLTGFALEPMMPVWGPFMHVTDFTHPITRDVDEGLFWGTDLNVGPVFRIMDGEARILGNVVFSQGRCAEGFGVKEYGEWRSVYMAAPNVPAAVLRGIARYAGAHVYSDAGDVLYASRELVAVHTLKGGGRELRLPRKVETIYDLYEDRTIARDADAFEVMLQPMSTSVYYAGDAARLGALASKGGAKRKGGGRRG